LGHIEKSKQNLEKQKKTQAKQKMVKCLVLTQKMFFVAFPMCFSFFLKWKSKKKLGFFGLFEWIRSIKISKKKINVFFGFSPFLVWFLH